MQSLFLTKKRENRGKGFTHYDFLYQRLLITNPAHYHFITADYLVSCQEVRAGEMETLRAEAEWSTSAGGLGGETCPGEGEQWSRDP